MAGMSGKEALRLKTKAKKKPDCDAQASYPACNRYIL